VIDASWGHWLGLLKAPLFHIGGSPVDSIGLISSGVMMLVGIALARRARRLFLESVAPRFHLHTATAHTVATLLFYGLLVVTALIFLSILGITLTNLAVVAGAMSVGIGFGLQNIANNFVSGLILLFDRAIKVGDFVELESGLKGRITQIKVRSTVILTNDGVEVIVPNSHLISNQVVNWTLSDEMRRLLVPFSVAYGSDIHRLRRIMLEQVPVRLPIVVQDDPERPPRLWFSAMGDSSLDFTLVLWIKAEAATRMGGSLSECLFVVHDLLIEHGFEIPFPQQDLHIRTLPAGVVLAPEGVGGG